MRALLMCVAAAAGRAVALYSASDAIHVACTISFSLVALLFASAALAALDAVIGHNSKKKPYSSAAVALHGLVLAIEMLLFGFGLRHCGPLRAVLLDSAWVTFRQPQSNHGRWRQHVGWSFLFLALLLLLGTHGEHPHRLGEGSRSLRGDVARSVDGAVPFVASDGTGGHHSESEPRHDVDEPSWWYPTDILGEAALVAASALKTLRWRGSQRLARAVGGPRRLFALTAGAAALWVLPLFASQPLMGGDLASASAASGSYSTAWWCSHAVVFAFLGLVMHEVPLGSSGLLSRPASAMPAADSSSLALGCAFCVGCVLDWLRDEHAAQLHTWLAALLLVLSLRAQLSGGSDGSGRDQGGVLWSYGAKAPCARSGDFLLPLHVPGLGVAGKIGFGAARGSKACSDGEDNEDEEEGGDPRSVRATTIGCIPQVGSAAARGAVGSLCGTSSTARLTGFIALNLTFMCVEAAVGLASGSLTLTTDAAHMLLDCAALAVGLAGETIASWPADERHPFGYARFDTLCALINGLLLLLVALSVSCEAFCRLLEPPTVDDGRLMPVAIGGLAINVFGLVYFHGVVHHTSSSPGGSPGGCVAAGCQVGGKAWGERNGRQTGGGNGGGSGTSKPAWTQAGYESACDHSRAGQKGGSANMRGVVLHVLADTMGSIATITSSLLATHLGWKRADPLCSLLVACLIVGTALPLVKDAVSLLLLRTPEALRGDGLRACMAAIHAVPHVREITAHRLWEHTPGLSMGTLTVVADAETPVRQVAKSVERVLRTFGIDDAVVQVVHDADVKRQDVRTSVELLQLDDLMVCGLAEGSPSP